MGFLTLENWLLELVKVNAPKAHYTSAEQDTLWESGIFDMEFWDTDRRA